MKTSEFMLLSIATASVSANAAQVKVDEARLATMDGNVSEWLTHGRTYSEQRYSPLARIHAGNVSTLGLAWYFDLDTDRGQEATPLAIDGTLYFSTAWSKVFALDARSGEPRWQFDPRISREIQIKVCCDVVNRGLASWSDKVFLGALDGRLIALDAASGKPVWSVQTVDPRKPYTITGAPRVVKGKVIIGNSGSEMGVRGYVSAYDAESGKLVWRFYTVPGNAAQGFENAAMRLAAKTWAGEWWKYGGGGTVWDAMAYDPELDLLYVGVGNGSPWNHQIRSLGRGDNLFLSSIVALDPDNGEYVWHFQTTPAETWDYTATQSIVLADLVIDGRSRKVLMQAPKNGFFYILDRATGEFISGQPYVPVSWAKGLDSRGRPIEVPEARYTRNPIVVAPGPSGGHNWYPMSFNPVTGLAYVPVQEMPSIYAPVASYDSKPHGWKTGIDPLPLSSLDDAVSGQETDTSAKGALLAWDPVSQRAAWRVTYRTVSNGGTLSTGGNLVFQGTSDGHFHAYAADSGKKLWSFPVQNAILGGPITYELDGEQIIVALAGLGGTTPLVSGHLFQDFPRGQHGRLLAFKLGSKRQLPPLPKQEPRRPLDVSQAKTKGDPLLGARRYSEYCVACHGTGAVSGPLMPDLRYSPVILDSSTFKGIVLDGSLRQSGMASFARSLTPADTEAVRAYLLWEAGNLAARESVTTRNRSHPR